jgi:hypothetical protein
MSDELRLNRHIQAERPRALCSRGSSWLAITTARVSLSRTTEGAAWAGQFTPDSRINLDTRFFFRAVCRTSEKPNVETLPP